LYLVYRDGSQKWETFLVGEFLPHIQARCHTQNSRGGRLIGGMSMGGLGALRLGLKHPATFGGIIAWEPSIEPALAWVDVSLEDRFWRTDAMLQARFGAPLDEAYWAANNPATIVTQCAAALREAHIGMYLEVGTEDAYGLHRGAEFLHRVLYDLGIPHEYRCVLGADHIGPTIGRRLSDGLAFVARILQPALPDPRVQQLRELVAIQKRRAGLIS
jgi:S-formylglutathione hydrolase